MSKSRFEQEYRDDELNTGARAKHEAKYKSPLTEVRWLRVICDEGHGFAGSASKTNAMAMLDKMFIERRWVVSGTPSSTLHGIEVGMVSTESSSKQQTSPKRETYARALVKRQAPTAKGAESKDFERLRLIVVNFLKLQPWANGKEDKADWKTYLGPRLDESGKRHSMPALREVMQTLIIRHRIEDLGYDLSLPPLHNKIVHLKPSYYDKVSINLFVTLLVSNFVTSEREDEDYMFHPRNRHKLSTLITNLSNATFYCISFTEDDVRATMEISNGYLNGHLDSISDEDGMLLTQAILNAERAIADPGWKAFGTLHEMGTYIEGFPDHAKSAWALDEVEAEPLLLGTTQTREVQKYVRSRIMKAGYSQDPCSSLAGAGLKVMGMARRRAQEEQDTRKRTRLVTSQKDIGTTEEPQKRAPTVSSATSPAKRTSRSESAKVSAGRRSSSQLQLAHALPDMRILGFASSKLAYLTDRILHVHPQEQTIIFYNHNNTAFFIAEAFELVGIPHLIYSNTLSVSQRAGHLSLFNNDPTFKVLIMDLKQAGQGLHVASASRVYIVSPIWDAALESQATKRAHRIGQTREVFVETLVLSGTIEETMIHRRKKSAEEKSRGPTRQDDDDGAKVKDGKNVKGKRKSDASATGNPMLDDHGMVKALKEITFLPLEDGEEKFSRLEKPVPLFRDQEVATPSTTTDPQDDRDDMQASTLEWPAVLSIQEILNDEDEVAHHESETTIPTAPQESAAVPSVFGPRQDEALRRYRDGTHVLDGFPTRYELPSFEH